MCFSSRLINAARLLLWGEQSAVFSPKQSMQTLFFRVGYGKVVQKQKSPLELSTLVVPPKTGARYLL